MYDVVYNQEVEEDLMQLSDELLEEALECFEKFRKDYFKYTLPLYNKGGLNLKGCRKTYFGGAEYRIVSKINKSTIEIVNIIAVGKREDLEIYRIANERLNK